MPDQCLKCGNELDVKGFLCDDCAALQGTLNVLAQQVKDLLDDTPDEDKEKP